VIDVSDKGCTENQNSRCLFNNFFFSRIVLFMVMWKNVLEPARPQMTI